MHHTLCWPYSFTQMSLFERLWGHSYHSTVPVLCTLYCIRLASLLHRMPRIWSLSWLWQPVAARQGAFSTLCSIFSQWYHLLFILSLFQSASSVCWMTRCLGKYVCTWAFGAWSVCVWRAGWGFVGYSEPDRNWQKHPFQSKFVLRRKVHLLLST